MSADTNTMRERRAEAMVQRHDWYRTNDYWPASWPRAVASGPLPRWMVVVSASDDHTYMTYAYYYASRERALDDLRRLMVEKGETPEHLLDLDTGDYRDVVIETTFTLADTFSGDPDDIDDDDEDEA